MNQKIVPLHIDGIHGSLYAGFLPRLGSLVLDFIFIVPVIFTILYLNGTGKDVFFYTVVPNLLFGVWYHIYLPKRYGGTPGKLVTGIRIIRLDGEPIGWKEAFMRHLVLLILSLSGAIMMGFCMLQADDAVFQSMGWMQQTQYVMTLAPMYFAVSTWVNNLWVFSEFIVLMTNDRKRAIHDYMAGTVIVNALYLDKIREVMHAENTKA